MSEQDQETAEALEADEGADDDLGDAGKGKEGDWICPDTDP